jgi:23S rRNA pseudouridine1911/1915/1917 synthase
MEVLYEDNHIIIVNKRNNDLVQGDKTGDVSLDKKLKAYLKEKYQKPGNVFLGVVHRLDRPVSGVVIFAKTSKALSRLNKMFNEKRIDKTYWAIVKQCPSSPAGHLKHYMVRNPVKNKSFAYDEQKKDAKLAELSYEVIQESDNYYLLEIKLFTGRHHQIRSQLSKIGSPIKGDLKYGFPRSNKDGGISLHARSVEFIHPVKKEKIEVLADPPDDNLWHFFAKKIEK